jgi:hypothetical protein
VRNELTVGGGNDKEEGRNKAVGKEGFKEKDEVMGCHEEEWGSNGGGG